MDMSGKDQFRVIADGRLAEWTIPSLTTEILGEFEEISCLHAAPRRPMTPVQDSTEILYGRVKRFKDMEMQVRCLAFANHDAPKAERPKDAISDVSLQIAQVGKRQTE
eukprot:4356697-Amphidinium_carterae.1